MIDTEGLYKLKQHTKCVLISIFSFMLAGIACIILAGATFTIRPEVLNQMYPDRYYIIATTIAVPIFYINGWIFCILCSRFGKTTIPLTIAIISILPFIFYYLMWGLRACISMVNS